MSLAQVALLALIQGLTEFLPVSSTAHLYLASRLFGWKSESLDLDIMLHLGTLVAVTVYFRGEWIGALHHFGLLWLLAVASVPVGAAGLLVRRQAERSWRNPFTIGVMLIAVALFMGLAEARGTKARDFGSLRLPDAITIGIGQAVAVIPGTSRSGVTMAAGMLRQLDRESAARFSFLLSTPAIAAAVGKAAFDRRRSGRQAAQATLPRATFLVGVLVSAVAGFGVLAWFLDYLRHGTLWPLVCYRTIFGIMVIALAFIRRPA